MGVLGVVDALPLRDAHQRLHFGHTLIGEDRELRTCVHLIVDVTLQMLNQLGKAAVQLRRFFRRAGDDQRRSRLIDQDAVDLVHDGIVERSLGTLVEVHNHVVPQVIEAELVVGAISDLGLIRFATGDGP